MAKAEPAALRRFFTGQGPVVLVRVAEVQGSAPREVNARMFVSACAQTGTIGGGRLEYLAVSKARAMLEESADHAQMDVPLGPDIGQCCGGRVVLFFHMLDAASQADALALAQADIAKRPEVYVFGAGHVGRALAESFMLLPVHVQLIDERREELAQCAVGITCIATALPEEIVRDAQPGSAFVIATHDHALDFMVTAAALEREDAAYVGMIGSDTKRARFVSSCPTTLREVTIKNLVCPIGALGRGDKRPEVIAAFVAAEVMAAFNAWGSPALTARK